MNKEKLDRTISYNNHATAMSELAISILTGNNPLDIRGVRELIGLYLLIPYMTNSQLDKPDINHNIPKLDINTVFTKVVNQDGTLSEMTLDRLRNAICHSFVAITDAGDLLVDDRASYDRKTHDALSDKGFCSRLESERTKRRLIELHCKVLEQQSKHNDKLQKEYEGLTSAT